MDRRLTTILSLDVVGYSRLMAADEAGTLTQLQTHRKELIEPKTAEYGGRVVKLMGDGTLMEFASVVDAIHFAVDVQQTMAEQNAKVPKDQQITYRVGINIGDIIVEGEDIYGDGVNIAARLEALADPGGICVARNVVDQVKSKVEMGFEDLGDQMVKNIPEPVQVFRVLVDSSVGSHGHVVTAPIKRTLRFPIVAGGLAVLVAVAGAALWQRPWEPREEPASQANMAFPLPDKPSIAVLPFNNMSNDPNQEHFVDGMTEDLITDLSKVTGLFVIARNSSFSYKGQSVKVRRVAEELGVRYVLEGSVRRVGEQLRVNAQLIDATTGGHVWAERFDGRATDIFAVQDEFVLKIVSALAITLSSTEKIDISKHQTDSIAAREAFQKGWELYSKFNEKDNEKAFIFFERATILDPEFGRAHAAMLITFWSATIYGWQIQDKGPSRTWETEYPMYQKRIEQFPSALGHVVISSQHIYEGSPDLARAEAAKAIALEPSDPEAHVAMAWALIMDGKPADGVKFIEAAMRLNPKYPGHYVLAHGIAYYALGELERAAQIFEQGRAQFPDAKAFNPIGASILAQLGRRKEARAVMLDWRPGADQAQLNLAPDGYEFPFQWREEHQWQRERLSDGIRVAAMPLELTVTSLMDELKNASGFGLAVAAQKLGLFGPAAAPAVPDLINALNDDDRTVREKVIATLGKIGPAAREAIPALTALRDEEFVGFHATDALNKIIRNQ